MGLFTKAAQFVAGRALNLLTPQLHEYFAAATMSHAGRAVGIDAALQVGTAFACARLNSTTFGSLSVQVQEKRDGHWFEADDHPLAMLVNDTPNADMSSTEFWTAMSMRYWLRGNAYAEITRQRLGPGAGRVVALTPLAGETTPKRMPNGALAYHHRDLDGRERLLDEGDVLHLKNTSLDGVVGLSPVALARHSIGLALAAEETTGNLYKNGLRTRGFLSAPTFLTDPQRKQLGEYVAKFEGAANAGKVPIFEGGFSFQQMMMGPAEAELLATRAFTVEEICRWFGTPPTMVGHTEKSTSWGTGLETMMLAFYQTTIRPSLNSAEGAVRRRLIPAGERGRVRIRWNYESMLRTDSKGRAEYLKQLVDAGILAVNDARRQLGEPPVDGGDLPTQQVQRVPLNLLGTVQRPGDIPDPAAAADPGAAPTDRRPANVR